jgi:hypothetical protein
LRLGAGFARCIVCPPRLPPKRQLVKGDLDELLPRMQKGNLDSIVPDEHGKIKKQTVTLQDVSVTRVAFDVGAKWSNDLK